MNSRSLVNIVLLIMVVALTSFLLWNNNDTSYLKLKLTSLNKSEINKITIPREKGDITLELSSSGWHMKTPYQAPAHEFRVNQLLNITQRIADNSYDINEMDLSQFGLNPSDTKIIFNQTLLEFGKTNPISMMRYIKTGDKLYLIHEQIYPLLKSQPSSFVSLSLLAENSEIKSITLPKFTVIKDSNNNWKISPENSLTADEVQLLVQNWKQASAFGVHAYMERKNLGEIKINLNNKLITFEISDNDPWLILARRELGIEYHLDKSYFEQLISPVTPETPDE